MNIVDVQNKIIQVFDMLWQECPVEQSNTTIDKSGLEEWVRITVNHGFAKPINLSMDAIRGGFVSIQVFTVNDIGSGRALELAVRAADIIRNIKFGTLTFMPYEIFDRGNNATGGLTTTEINWFQVNAMIDFQFVD